jgi:WD40 repeat protein
MKTIRGSVSWAALHASTNSFVCPIIKKTLASGSQDDTIKLWDVATGKQADKWPSGSTEPPSQYTLTFDVAFSGKDLLHARFAGLR